MKNCLIISGGNYSNFLDFINLSDYDFIIACDKGLEYAIKQGVEPDLVLGDFDSCSLSQSHLEKYKQVNKLIQLPCEKNDTDTLYAVKYAIKNGTKKITIICALGNRLDHTFSNFQSLNYAAKKNVDCKILSENEQVFMIRGRKQIKISKNDNYSLSVFSYSNKSFGVRITGCKYNVNNKMLLNYFPLGQSNIILDEYATIFVRHGTLLIICSAIN